VTFSLAPSVLACQRRFSHAADADDRDAIVVLKCGGDRRQFLIAAGEIRRRPDRRAVEEDARLSPVRPVSNGGTALLFADRGQNDFGEQRPIVADRNEIPVCEPGEEPAGLAFDDSQQDEPALLIEWIGRDCVLPFGLAMIAGEVFGR
jgi:hypothetical protein